ncbi:Uncharacterised protein [Providencia alcalifaciens]|nr:Uncharacterised protein [Providencia alcalifaciens]
MFSVDALLESAFPQQTLPAWKRKLLKRLLHEKDFQQLAEDYPHLKGSILLSNL